MDGSAQLILGDCIYPRTKVTLRVWEALLSCGIKSFTITSPLGIIKPGLLRIGLKDTSSSIDALLECS